MYALNFISISISNFPFFIFLNEVVFLENCLKLQVFPIRKDPRKGHLSLKPWRVLVHEMLTVSDKPTAETCQKQISHDVVGPYLLNSAATESDTIAVWLR